MSRSPIPFHRRALLTTVAGVFAVALLAIAGGQALADDEGAQTLEGEYFWTGGNTGGELKAEFKSSGDGTWDVEFFFDFRDKPHVYTGTAKGSLSAGSLEGEVKNENRGRTFIFAGEVVDGTFKGDHAEIREGGERETGTLTLSAGAGS